ncbi:LuxR family transcriptional regulator [Tamlana fucoidanivorans]|uniref:LuxR family transcriptional regulator n=1 Tax=Allotamlana fucoidanivorans TaxID=2583814 RepID=A0A5C4SHW5_9FLAO|nr:LuxR family transcriptional regulator [Tamlana fucoidanivorans]
MFVWFTFLCLTLPLQAQEHPPIKIYHPKDYGAETQNWGISQSKDKFIYVANNKGLLEFNGSVWSLYPSPNESIMRSVNVIDDIIYTGCNNEFGFWKKNKFNKLEYTSLSNQLNINFHEDEEFWNIIHLDHHILFQSLKRIYIVNKKNNTYNTIESDDIIYKVFVVNSTIYFQKTKNGIYKIENGKAILISDDKIIKNSRLVNIFKMDESLLVQTENNGFYILNNQKLSKWDIPANNTLNNYSVFRSTQLSDGSYILGTRSSGILRMTASGEIDYNINMIDGLGNNTIHWIFEDLDKNIWLALENGINCINIHSPFKIYNDEKGKLGTVYTSKIFKDYLYLGTNQGLFYKPLNKNIAFKAVTNINAAVWNLVEIDGYLFCGHDGGTSIINDGQSKKINGTLQGTWNIKPIKNNPNLLIQGCYNGLNIIELQNGQWTFRNKISGFELSSRYFEFYDNHIFVSHEYKGVFKLKLNNDFTQVETVEKVPNIDKEINSSLITYNNQLLFSSKEGVFKYNAKSNLFEKDSLISSLFNKNTFLSGKLIHNKDTKTLWAFSKNTLNYLAPGNLSSEPKINTIAFSKLLPKGLTGYENISHISNKSYLIGTSSGFVILDLDKLKQKPYYLNLNEVVVRNNNYQSRVINKNENGLFKNTENDITFQYGVPQFQKYLDTEYQYQLKGRYNNWSEWSTNTAVLFENLSFGDYIFKVRARIGNELSQNTIQYNFKIERPWALSNLMLSLYALAFILFSFLMHTLYRRYYKKQREQLLKKSARELELKALENQQQLMKFRNDKLRQDIDNKNRELGISTMSLIKKNEFLNTIKQELLNTKDLKGIKQVIRIIDRNLNNTDDWHTFEEAFNNADKDFLKKIKALHPKLTSNDLRLCAYLRLNLTSKEIAPLLNISPRSVEVKRYRLRKKMDLEHESSLTDYILQI